jgi:hypothetical protein
MVVFSVIVLNVVAPLIYYRALGSIVYYARKPLIHRCLLSTFSSRSTSWFFLLLESIYWRYDIQHNRLKCDAQHNYTQHNRLYVSHFVLQCWMSLGWVRLCEMLLCCIMPHRIMPFSIMPLSIMPLSLMPLSLMTLSIMTLSIMTLSIMASA